MDRQCKKTTNNLHMDRQCKKNNKQFTYGQYIFTDCTEDNVQNTHRDLDPAPPTLYT